MVTFDCFDGMCVVGNSSGVALILFASDLQAFLACVLKMQNVSQSICCVSIPIPDFVYRC